MRVTHVIFNLRTGGTELMLLDIMAHQLRQGADVSLVVINSGHDEAVLQRMPEGVDVVMLNRPVGSKNPLWLWRYNKALRGTKPDVVHFHNDKSVGMTWPAAMTTYVATVHATNVQLAYTHRRIPEGVCAISQSVCDDLHKRYDLTPQVVYNGIDTALIRARSGSAKPEHGPFRIVQVGRLMTEKKGQHLLLDAISKLPLDVEVQFLGDGPSRTELEQLAHDLGVDGKVRFLGSVSRAYVYEHLADFDLFIQPSLYEGFGLTVAEAMAAKVPVLVSALEGPMEVINHGEMGSHFATDDADDLAQKIREIAADYPRHLALAQGKAYDWVVKNFSIEQTAANYLAFYREAMYHA